MIPIKDNVPYMYKNVNFNLVNEFLLNNRKSYLPTPPLGQDMTQGQFF